MLIAILAFLALAATAAVVIRDADPNAGARAVAPASETAPTEQTVEQLAATDTAAPEEDPPTQAIDMTVVGFPEATLYDPMVDAPTESMPAVAFGGAQAAAILPYPARFEPEPVAAIDPSYAPDPDRLIQHVVLLDESETAQGPALARLIAGIAIAGGVVGLSLIGVGRAISALLGH